MNTKGKVAVRKNQAGENKSSGSKMVGLSRLENVPDPLPARPVLAGRREVLHIFCGQLCAQASSELAKCLKANGN